MGPLHSFGMWQKLQAGDTGNRETVLECYAKVAEADKAGLLKRSGANGIFVAELTRDQAKPIVDWIQPGDVVGPAYLLLAQRQAAAEGRALAFRRGGGAALGLRVEPGKAAGDRTCTWRARHVPRDWVEEDLLGAFTAAGFIDFEVVSPGRGSLPCAKLKDDGGLPSLVIQTENHSIDVERAVAKRRMINLDTEKLQFSGRGATAPRRTVNPAPSNAAATGPATNGTNALAGAKAASKGKGNQAGQATTGTNTGAQDPQTTGGGDRARSRSPVRGPSDWYDIGAGQCFFNVVGAHYAVYRDGYTWKDACKLAKARGAILRSEIASYIREKPDHFKPFWLPPPTPADETEKENLTQMEGGAPPTTWEEYLQALDRPGRWCDDLTFRAMTKRLNCRILLIVGDIAAPDQVIAYGKRISYKDDRRQLGCGSGLIQRWPLPTHCAESWQGTPPGVA